MWNNGHDAYLESRVTSADPVELVNMLYQACTIAVREARHHLAEGRIAERSREINKAFEILVELDSALDHQLGGEISQRLALLYDYMRRRLMDANMKQSDPPLTEVLGLLSTLSEGWSGVRTAQAKPVERAQSPWAQPLAEEAVACGSHGWSL
jgi:flagellar secretion chaperone FliS